MRRVSHYKNNEQSRAFVLDQNEIFCLIYLRMKCHQDRL